MFLSWKILSVFTSPAFQIRFYYEGNTLIPGQTVPFMSSQIWVETIYNIGYQQT